MPQVSVIIATYNRAGFIGEAIDSVLAQTFKDYEIIVVDDGSTDNTKQVLEKYGDKIKYFYQQNKWQPAAANLGTKESSGAYIAFLDDDDVWLPNKLEVQIGFMNENKSIGFVCSEALFVNLQGDVLYPLKKRPGKEETFISLFEENCIGYSTVVVRKNVLEEVGGFDETLKTTQDFDLWLRLAKKHNLAYMNIPLVRIKRHSEGKSNDKVQKLKDRLYIITKQENLAHLNFVGKRIRIAKEYYWFAGMFREISNYSMAAKCYLKAVMLYPFIGAVYRSWETRKSPLNLPYRILKVYLLSAYCYYKELGTVMFSSSRK